MHVLSPADGQVPLPPGVYPLNGIPDKLSHRQQHPTPAKPEVFPDFKVWKHTPRDDTIMRSHLQKGYYEAPIVANECHSGRQVMTKLLHQTSSSAGASAIPTAAAADVVKSKLANLSDAMIEAINERRAINRIRGKSSYKPPPRVTLNEHKRELWLKNLSNPAVPLRQLSKAIPHGLRNKALFEQCLQHKVPIPRAIWLIKCVASNEQRQLKRKQAAAGSGNCLTSKWIVDWTDQITTFVEQTYEASFASKKTRPADWKYRFQYTLELVTNLYLGELMNQESFLAWVVHYLSKVAQKHHAVSVSVSAPATGVTRAKSVLVYKTLSLHYLVVHLFWFRLIQIDYLSKELGESLLLVLAALHDLPNDPASSTSHTIATKLTAQYQILVRYLFYYNSDNFVLPSTWHQLRPHLKRAIEMSINAVAEQFKLLTYRNESLMIDETDRLREMGGSHYCYNKPSQLIYQLDNFTPIEEKVKSFITTTHSTEPIAGICEMVFSDSNSQQLLSKMLHWASTTDRESRTDSQRTCLTSSVLQARLAEIATQRPKKAKMLRLQLEAEITEYVYSMASELNKAPSSSVCSFLVFVYSLHQMGLFVGSTYLRRLIASGLIYLPEADRSCNIHLLVLHTLALSDTNTENILKRLSDTTGINLPVEQEAKLTENTKKGLTSIMDYIFGQSSENQDNISCYIYDLGESCGWADPEDPMQIGCKLEIGNWFMEQLQAHFTAGETMHLNIQCITLLYKVTLHHFHCLPQLILLLWQKTDQGQVKFENDDTWTSLIKMTAGNKNLLSSYITSGAKSVYEEIVILTNSWISNDRFNIVQTIQDCGIEIEGRTSTNVFTCRLTSEELALLGISSKERLGNAAEYSHHLNSAMAQYFSVVKGFKPEMRAPVLTLLRSLQAWKPDDFASLLAQYLRKFVQPTISLDYSVDLKLILRLIADDLFPMTDVCEVFAPQTSTKLDEFSSSSNKRLHWDIFFSKDLDIEDDVMFNLEFERLRYRRDHPSSFYNMMLTFVAGEAPPEVVQTTTSQDVQMGGVDDVVPVDVMNSLQELASVSMGDSQKSKDDSTKQFNSGIVDSIWHLSSCNMDLFTNLFYSKNSRLNSNGVRKLFYEGVLKLGSMSDDRMHETEVMLHHLNYFNLPICQWIFADTVKDQIPDVDDEYEFHGKIAKSAMELLSCMASCKPPADLYLVGELFEFVPNEYKLKILSACEDSFLGSDSFPKYTIGSTDGHNMTKYLTNIISSCSRLDGYEPGTIPMSDALVFSLNLSLEKLLWYCHKLEHTKASGRDIRDLEDAIKLISKIVLIHRNFLVDLIMKRSVNLQRDVLLINLVKLFSCRSIDKNPKLKNLLYDILISIKILISESAGRQYQKQQQQQQQQMAQSKLSPLAKTVATPSFFSPAGDSPITNNINSAQATPQESKTMSGLNWKIAMTIEPPNVNNRLKFLLPKFNMHDALKERERNYCLMDEESEQLMKYRFKSFEMIEDANPHETLNDTSISLQMFDCSMERKNPP